MDEEATAFETLIKRVEGYGKTNLKLFKLLIISKSAEVIATLITNLLVLVIVVMAAVSASIALALWIGELLGKTYYGFLAMAALYTLIAFLLYIFREQLLKIPVSNKIISQLNKTKIYEEDKFS